MEMGLNDSKNIASVYWIRGKTDTDIFSQGYVGVSINPHNRISQHLSDSHCGRHENKHLERGILKNGSDVVFGVVLTGSEDYCYTIESKLRPFRSVGWNIAEGGNSPPNMKGIRLSEEHRCKLRVPKSPSHKEKIRLAKLGDKNPMVIHKPTKEQVEKRTNSISRDWVVTNPNGETFQIKNLRAFCDANNLDRGTMSKVASGDRNHCSGWKCVKVIL